MFFTSFFRMTMISLIMIALSEGQTWQKYKDLRIYLDLSGNLPVNYKGAPLTNDEILQQTALGLNLWQSILPDMNYQFVSSLASSNFFVDFTNLSGGAGAQTDEFNHIHVNLTGIGGKDNDFISNKLVHEYFSWVYNPLANHWGPASNPSICTTLPNPTTPRAAFDAGTVEPYRDNQSASCFLPSQFPDFGKLVGFDLAYLIQHESGHCLMNFSTNGVPIPSGQQDHSIAPSMIVNGSDMYFPNYIPNSAWTRRPVYEPNFLTRRRADGTSIMFSGDGSSLFNSRGIFPIDVNQLINENYRVTYPNISGAIVLSRPNGSVYITSNWDEAQKKMVWPNQGTPLTQANLDTAWFLVDVYPRTGTHKILAAGERHTLFIKDDGQLWAWGANEKGQLGDGTTNPSLNPKWISSGPWVSVTAGLDFSLGIKADGTLWAWGDNSQGQIGDPTITANQLIPRKIGNNSDWLSVSAGALHVVALKKNGRAYGWGYNAEGQLGIGNKVTPTRTPTLVCATGGACESAQFVEISSGANHTLALDRQGVIWGWGTGSDGQLLYYTSATIPVALVGNLNGYRWSSVEAGHAHSAALANGQIYTWGLNQQSQLGQGWSGGYSATIGQEASMTSNWAYLMPAQWNSGGILNNGSWFSWGHNYSGQLGDGTLIISPLAVREKTNSTDWTLGASRQSHSLALRKDGTLWGWGSNVVGELGTGTTGNTNPIPVKTKYIHNTVWVTQSSYPASPSTTPINLTSAGTMNWTKWNSSSPPNTKQTSTFRNEYRVLQPVGNYQLINATSVNVVTNNNVNFSWATSDEINNVAGSNVASGISVAGTNANRGFRLTVPARNIPKTLNVYVGAYRVSGKLTVKLSDGSVPTYTNTALNSPSGATTNTNGMYAITFSSLNPNTNLIVEWTVNAENVTSGSRFVILQAAAIR